jgi:long-subunit acyl-CoA synthetase (AMP-forming)
MSATEFISFNHIHKRLMVLYNISDMRLVWKKVRSEFKKEFKVTLPKRFKKYPKLWEQLNIWIESRINQKVLGGGEDIKYFNKSDLKERGWSEKLIKLLYPNPDKVIYLGRGRYAYYYNGSRLGELEDSDEFIEEVARVLARKRRLQANKESKLKNGKGKFGTEFIRD